MNHNEISEMYTLRFHDFFCIPQEYHLVSGTSDSPKELYEDGELKEGLFEAKRKESRGD